MESTEHYFSRLRILEIAIQGFDDSLSIGLSSLDNILKDTIRNGQVRNFKYSTELLWKVIKHFLSKKEGIDERTPKGVIKAFFRAEDLSESLYESLCNMIDHRNLFSHVYNEHQFLQLYEFLPSHYETMKSVLPILQNINK